MRALTSSPETKMAPQVNAGHLSSFSACVGVATRRTPAPHHLSSPHTQDEQHGIFICHPCKMKPLPFASETLLASQPQQRVSTRRVCWVNLTPRLQGHDDRLSMILPSKRCSYKNKGYNFCCKCMQSQKYHIQYHNTIDSDKNIKLSLYIRL